MSAELFAPYTSTFWALWVILVTLLVQVLVAAISHRLQKKSIPGILEAHLGHSSFVFRSHRTHQNSLENIALIGFPVFLGVLTGVSPQWLSLLTWVYAVARIAHMALYYAIATEKNPSPRSYFYLIALGANLCVMALVASNLSSG